MGLLSLLAGAAPWILGAELALITSCCSSNKGLPKSLLIAVFGYLGCVVFALGIWLADQAGETLLNSQFLITLFIFEIVLLGILLLRLVSVRSTLFYKFDYLSPQRVWFSVLIFGVPSFLVLASAFQLRWAPLQAWDAIDFWILAGTEFVAHSDRPGNAPYQFSNGWRHPYFVSMMSAWSAWSSDYFDKPNAHWLWLVLHSSIYFVVYGFARYFGNGKVVAAITGTIAVSVPLLENHGNIFGYSELFLVMALMLSASLIAIGLDQKVMHLLMLGLLVGVTMAGVRNTGLVYVFLLLLALGLYSLTMVSRGWQRGQIFVRALLLVPLISLLILAQPSIVREAILGDVGTVSVFGKDLELSQLTIKSLFFNHVTAWFENSTFSILFLLTIIFGSLIWRDSVTGALLFLFYVVYVGLLVMASSQLTGHAYDHAVPSNDTGHSRFSLPIFMILPLVVSSFIGRFRLAAARYRTYPRI